MNTARLRSLLLLSAFALLPAPAVGQWTPGTNLIHYLGGNVGIGTSTPTEKLHVEGGSMRTSHWANGAGILSMDQSASIELGNSLAAATAPYLDFHFGKGQAQDFNTRIMNDADGRLSLIAPTLYSTGNVGIGTWAPAAPLHVMGSAIVQRSVSTGAADLSLLSADGPGGWFLSLRPNSGKFGIVQNTAGFPERLVVDTTGNVGIGAASPQHLLSVNGAIAAKDVIVTASGWPDHVFRPGYRLAPLSELENHIQRNGHLPGIPSETEVKEKGVNVAEMQARLLAKIEELTLHVIRQEKENRRLRQRLTQENRELRSRLTRLESR